MRAALVLVLASSPVFADKVAPPPCIKQGSPVRLSYERDAFGFCVDDSGTLTCYSVESSTGRVFRAASPAGKMPDNGWPMRAPKPGDAAATATVDGHAVTACKASACKTITTKIDDARAAINEAGTLVVVWPGGGGVKTKIEVWDVATGKLAGTIRAGTQDDPFIVASLAGDTVIVDESNGAGPDNRAWLATKTGKRLGPVGGKKDFGTASLAPVHVKDALWAFNSAEGDVVVVQDVKTGKVARTIKVGLVGDPFADMVGDGRRLVLIAWYPERGPELAVVDLATDKVARYTLAACKQ